MRIKSYLFSSLVVTAVIFSPTILGSSTSQAQTDDYKNTVPAMTGPVKNPYYVVLGAGASISRLANISVGSDWDPANEGYNGRLGTTPLFTAGAGYQFSSLISSDVELTYRPSYRYSQFQTPAPGSSSTPGFLGSKTRKFDLANTSAMLNVFLHGQGINWITDMGPNTTIQPFVGAGLGISRNTVSNFHSDVSSPAPGQPSQASIMSDNSNIALAWQLTAGVEVLQSEKWGVDVGYRYFDGGRFKSNNKLTDQQNAAVSAWTGRVRADEVYLNLKYLFGA